MAAPKEMAFKRFVIATQRTSVQKKPIKKMSLSEVINNPMVQSSYRVLSQVYDQFQSLDSTLLFNILFLNHAFIIALMVKRAFNGLIATQKVKEIPFVAGMLLCFAIGTGGAILTSLLLGKTQIFFTNDTINLYLIWYVEWRGKRDH